MPKVLVVGEFAVVIFTNDHPPPHVHVRKAGMLVKIALEPEVVLLRYDKDLSASDLRKAVNIVKDNREFLLAKWNELHPPGNLEGENE
jgi:hypothetical protein